MIDELSLLVEGLVSFNGTADTRHGEGLARLYLGYTYAVEYPQS